jgi:hypothetical protein
MVNIVVIYGFCSHSELPLDYPLLAMASGPGPKACILLFPITASPRTYPLLWPMAQGLIPVA